jgi:thymidine kinase
MDRNAERGSRFGSIEVIYGPMFSGKSDVLIETLRIAQEYGKENVQAFYPHVDDRGKPGTINTANGKEFPATEVFSSKEIKEKLRDDATIVAVDEAQFMDMDLPAVCIDIAAMGKKVIVAGLATDFKNDTFGPMGGILAIADKSDKRVARCKECGVYATRTQRFVMEEDGSVRPARRDEDVVVVGGKKDDVRGNKTKSFYEARCPDHHIVDNPLQP